MRKYHIREIKKAPLNTIDKIIEEAEEFLDSVEQECFIMAWLELTDLYNAFSDVFSHMKLRNLSDGVVRTDLYKSFDELKQNRDYYSASLFLENAWLFMRNTIGKLQAEDVIKMAEVTRNSYGTTEN